MNIPAIRQYMTCSSGGIHKAKELRTLQYFLKEQRQRKSTDLFTTVLAFNTLHKQPFSKGIMGSHIFWVAQVFLKLSWLVPVLVKFQATMVRKASPGTSCLLATVYLHSTGLVWLHRRVEKQEHG